MSTQSTKSRVSKLSKKSLADIALAMVSILGEDACAAMLIEAEIATSGSSNSDVLREARYALHEFETRTRDTEQLRVYAFIDAVQAEERDRLTAATRTSSSLRPR